MPYSLNLSYSGLVEGILAFLLICYGYYLPRIGRRFILGFPIALAPLRRRPVLLILAAGLAPVLLRLALLPIVPIPTPVVMEEFNNVLQAQTYAAGRLYNPVHPLAVLLQAPQVIQWPHYMSTRPPLSGLFLYVGQMLFGHPFFGNLLSVGLTSAALCWMMLEWLSRRWAAVGAVIIVVGYCLFGYWINSYWCPAPNILGAAVLLALVPRIERRPQLWQAAVFTLATALLMGIRPYENGVYVATVFAWIGIGFLQPARRAMLGRAVLLFALPVGIGGMLIGAGLAWYNLATMGNAGILPYSVWRLAQCFVPSFLWQPMPARSIVFLDQGLAKFAAWEVEATRPVRQGGLVAVVAILSRQVITLRDQIGPMLVLPLFCWSPRWFAARPAGHWFIAGTAVTLSLLFVSWLYFGLPLKLLLLFVLWKRLRNEGERLPVVLIAVGLLATSISTFYMSIYFSVFLPPLILLAVGGLRFLALWNPHRGAGVAGMLVLGILFFTGLQACSHAVSDGMADVSMARMDAEPSKDRDMLLARLGREAGRQLVLVRNLAPGKAGELVWNGADVDRQRIIWARDLKPEWSAAAIRYFHPDKVWLVEMTRPDEDHPEQFNARIRPYPVGSLRAPAPLNSLPMPDKAAAEALGVRR